MKNLFVPGTQAQFRMWAMEFVKDSILKTLTSKGDEYAELEKPALINFIDNAALLELSVEHNLMVQASKHWHTLAKYTAGKRDLTVREVVSRCTDIIIYMMLLCFWTLSQTEQDEEQA